MKYREQLQLTFICLFLLFSSSSQAEDVEVTAQPQSYLSCIRATQILVDQSIEPDQVVTFQNGIIEQIIPWHESIRSSCQNFQEAQGILSPGLIDIHIHGAGGYDVMDAIDNPDALRTIGMTLLKEGVTTWLPTTTSTTPEKLSKILASIASHAKQQRNDESAIAGIHMEGPFISKEKSGCHPHATIQSIDIEKLTKWQDDAQNSIRIVTFAPELEQSDALVEWCNQNNVISSIGHTNASEFDVKKSIADGAIMGTHLFNAMSQTRSRDAGAAMSILDNTHMPFEIILDGIHLSEPLVRIAWQMSRQHPERFVLITDAIRAKGLPNKDGIHNLGDGIKVRVNGFRSTLVDNPNTLAGSVLTMPYAIHTMQRITGCSQTEALLAASYNPAKSIKHHNKIGSLAPGMTADMVLFSSTKPLSVISVWRSGVIVRSI